MSSSFSLPEIFVLKQVLICVWINDGDDDPLEREDHASLCSLIVYIYV